jgi:hypothetical protein
MSTRTRVERRRSNSSPNIFLTAHSSLTSLNFSDPERRPRKKIISMLDDMNFALGLKKDAERDAKKKKKKEQKEKEKQIKREAKLSRANSRVDLDNANDLNEDDEDEEEDEGDDALSDRLDGGKDDGGVGVGFSEIAMAFAIKGPIAVFIRAIESICYMQCIVNIVCTAD